MCNNNCLKINVLVHHIQIKLSNIIFEKSNISNLFNSHKTYSHHLKFYDIFLPSFVRSRIQENFFRYKYLNKTKNFGKC